MKKIILLVIIFYSQFFPQEEVIVTFNVATPYLKDSSTVFITGNNSRLGEWNPSAVSLIKTDSINWQISLLFPAGEKLEYKFTRGTWDSEAVNDSGETPVNYFLDVNDDTTLNFSISYWKDQFEKKTVGQITGNVKYHTDFKGTGIRARDIIVWLPPGYENDSTKRYPVLYAHDGQNIFDPSTSTFGIDWQIDERADSLIKAGTIEPVIVIGIYNTPERRYEYTNTDTGDAYMNFIVNELKPFIDKSYRTKPGKENTATIGSSAGGLISFMLVWEHSNVFAKAACLSPAFNIEHINYLPSVDSVKDKKPVKIYIDNGGLGLEERLQPGVDEMIKLLLKKGYIMGKDLYWFKDEQAEHSEKSWANRVAMPLKFLFGK